MLFDAEEECLNDSKLMEMLESPQLKSPSPSLGRSGFNETVDDSNFFSQSTFGN